MNAAQAILRGQMREDDTYAVALYTELPAGDTYTTSGEVVGVGYKAGGKTLDSPVYGESDTGAWLNFTGTVVWSNATIRANGAIIYNERSKTILKSVKFAKEVSSTNHRFEIELPKEEPLIEILYRSK